MSRAINLEFVDPVSGAETKVEIRNPYWIFGHQQPSKTFWGLPELHRLGIKRLTELGETDPIYFYGWDALSELQTEINILLNNLHAIPFHAELKAQWLSHLIYCHSLLVLSAPKDSEPRLTIG
jgi:hypothetical protein